MKKLVVVNLILASLFYIVPATKYKPVEKVTEKAVIEEKQEVKVTSRSLEEPRKEVTTISQNGIDLIKKFEGCRLQAYKLKNEKYYTIGFGHYSSDNYAGQQITQDQAETLLKNDLQRFEGYVKSNCKHLNLNQNEFDALVSFSFNCGQGNLQKLIKNRTKEEIADKMLEYTKSASESNRAGLKRRRTAEKNLFLGGNINEKRN